MEGGTALIYLDERTQTVQKVLKRKSKRTQPDTNILREKKFHRIISHVLGTDLSGTYIRVPKLYETASPFQYKMDYINTDISVDSDHMRYPEVNHVIQEFMKRDIVLLDIEAYLQPNGMIMLLDFGQVYSTHSSKETSCLAEAVEN